MGMGKATLAVGHSPEGVETLRDDSAEINALLGRGELGIQLDADSGEYSGMHAGVGIAPGRYFKVLRDLAKGNKLASAYVNNMVSVGLSRNEGLGILRLSSKDCENACEQ